MRRNGNQNEDVAAALRDKGETKAILKRVIGLFKPHKKEVFLTGIAVLVAVILGLAPPFLLQIIIDQGIAQNDFQITTTYSIWTVVLVLAAAAVTVVYGYLGVVIGQRIMCEIRDHLFSHLQKMSLRFFTSTRTGEIQTRLISDVQGVQVVLGQTVTDAVSNLAIVVSAFIAMLILDWRLTILSVVMIPFFAVLGKYVGDFARDVRKGVQEQTGNLNAMMQETLSISGILLTKTSGQPASLHAKFDVENQELARWQIKQQLLQYLFFGLIRLITTLAPALVYWLAGYLIFRGDESITVGVLVAFTGLQIRFFFPLTALMGTQVEILSSVALFKRIFEYLDLPVDVQERPGAKVLDSNSIQGRVEVKDIKFSYDPELDRATLADIDFVAEPGTLTALVGPSGAGKTTLMYMIPRLYDVDSGSVKIDDVDIRDLTLESLQASVGAVTQETYLLHATVKDNLRIAKPDATDEELIAACKSAAIHDHIASLDQGYDTVVGERGYKLSGGEKQRLAIARAILKNPRILILDEATSALDTRSERLIQQSLAELMKGRTTFAIAHRLSTILAADQILVLQDGRLIEKGKHADLLALGGLYARLYNEQFLAADDAEREVEAETD